MSTLIDYFNQFAKKEGDAFSYRTGFRSFKIPYKELYNKVLQFAAHLEKNKIKKGDKLLIWSYNSPEWVICFFACVIKGIIVIPVDFRSNKEFAAKLKKLTDAKAILCSKFKQPNLKIKTFYAEDFDLYLNNKESWPIKANENDLVEIVYTSGTTGAPKGVMITHKNLVSNINSIKKLIHIDESFTFLSALPLSHLFEQTTGMLVPLVSGSKIIYITSLKASSIFEAFEEENITNMILVPRLLKLFADKIKDEVKKRKKEGIFNLLLSTAKNLPFKSRKILFCSIHKRFGKKFRYFVVGGATFDPELEKFWNLLGFKVVQGYGLTETSPVISCNQPEDFRLGSIGKIIPGVKVELSKNNEILVQGDNVFKGYYKDPKKTKKVFINDWFNTEDLGYFKDNFLYLHGREKDMIVTSEGINIYPEDIETLLNQEKGVKDSCIVGLPTKEGEIVYAVLLLEKNIDPKNIIEKINSKLDTNKQIKDYSIWPYEDFPRTTTLKIKKNIVLETIQKKAVKKAPVTTKHSKLYELIARTTRYDINKIKPNSKLHLDLGLGSIDRVELTNLLEQEFNIDFDEELIGKNTTVKEVEKFIEERKISKKRPFRKFILNKFFILTRLIVYYLILLPIITLFARIKISGKENLKQLKEPAIFVSNHQSHFDILSIMRALPIKIRIKLATAAFEEYFFKDNSYKNFHGWWTYQLGTTLLNLYPIPQTRNPRKSIEHTGKLLDKGFNILLFPEGHRTKDGKIHEFMNGIGLIAYHMKAPIIPVKIEGLFDILPIGRYFPKHGKATIKVGKPMKIKETSFIEITKKIEKSVREL
ncbi:AMP-binding protein [Candidatus Woesearchaeota archaeon]|nr:AMP-binding protein [Candidatus Woesearchaeota archaeon]